MKCSTCGAPLTSGSKCRKCGTLNGKDNSGESRTPSTKSRGSARMIYCSDCGEQISERARECKNCGAPVSGGKSGSSGGSQKSRLVFILLGIFLGAFGVHNFYAGYNGKGAAQLLITLLLGWLVIPWIAVEIWALIEIITVKEDKNGVEFS